jgi:hypothetical protein
MTDTGEIDLDVEGIIFGIWDQRNNSTFVQNAVELISEFLLNRVVFEELEFYLPQLGHMIIHLGGKDEAILHSLDRLCVILCQASLHVALKLTFILKASMEDYQEETCAGVKNPFGNAALFMRCARLLYIIEKVVIYGLPLVQKEETLDRSMSGFYEETGFRDFANKVLGSGSEDKSDEKILQGKLLYKRRARAFLLQRKVWKERWFKIEHRILYCFHDPEYKILRRSVNLKDCIVDNTSGSNHKHYFEVRDCTSDIVFQLRASSDAEAASWIGTLKHVSVGVPRAVDSFVETFGNQSFTEPELEIADEPDTPYTPTADAFSGPAPNAAVTEESLLTPQQRERFKFFNEEQEFVKALTDICERLRFVERDIRGENLEREQQSLKLHAHRTYIPLCRSTDTWSAVLAVLPSEGHAFTTKARCPALMMFEIEQHPMKMDVASFLFTDLSVDAGLMLPVPPALTNHPISTDTSSPGTGASASVFKRSCSRLLDGDADGTKSTGDESDEVTSPATPPNQSIFHAPVKRLSVCNLNTPSYQAARQVREMSYRKEAAEAERAKTISTPKSTAGDGDGDGDAEVEKDDTAAASVAVAASAAGTTGGDVAVEAEAEVKEETQAWTTGSETFAEKARRLQKASEYTDLKNWKLDGLIAKSNDDLRQEVFVIQLISFYQKIFKEANVDVLLYSYQIMSTSKTTGLIQLIPDSISIDALKKQPSWPGSLRGHFEQSYGPVGSPAFEAAMGCYVRSLAGYSIVTYLLALKDR